ncbi:MAG TPA: hypothetical protein PKY77_13935 [Phycisphaerae bacterium]|nr:hypothetical protein [Phycisphaerae bacterium]HRY67759.1 hypothetical protein [Phycisphaerae bacterium]HSA25211.1 hypothetical protein [Phycisphaerae bacterium]
MRFLRNRLFSFTLPTAIFILPLMEASLDQIPAYLKGDEFRQIIGEIIIQIVSGVLDAFIMAVVALFYGLAGVF